MTFQLIKRDVNARLMQHKNMFFRRLKIKKQQFFLYSGL